LRCAAACNAGISMLLTNSCLEFSHLQIVFGSLNDACLEGTYQEHAVIGHRRARETVSSQLMTQSGSDVSVAVSLMYHFVSSMYHQCIAMYRNVSRFVHQTFQQ
jgi:hypothetical protein